jgi:hypothetical protein
MKQPSYEELWLLAFVDKKTECFNKNYFDYYVRRSKEYRECSIIMGSLAELKKMYFGLIFTFDNKCFMIAPNINFWYNRDYHLFIGWFFWGFDIVIKE